MSATAAETFRLGPRGRRPDAPRKKPSCSRARKRASARRLQMSASAPRLEEIKLDAPRVTAPASLSFCTSPNTTTAPRTPTASPIPTSRAALARDYANAPDVVAYPRNEAGRRRRARLGRRRGRDRHAVRRRIERVRRRRAASRSGHKGAVTIDLRQMGKVNEVDKTSRAALIEGGTYGPALEAQLRPHGAHAAPFSAELRIFHARRLDRDARRRPLRDALHPHRRFR